MTRGQWERHYRVDKCILSPTMTPPPLAAAQHFIQVWKQWDVLIRESLELWYIDTSISLLNSRLGISFYFWGPFEATRLAMMCDDAPRWVIFRYWHYLHSIIIISSTLSAITLHTRPGHEATLSVKWDFIWTYFDASKDFIVPWWIFVLLNRLEIIAEIFTKDFWR